MDSLNKKIATTKKPEFINCTRINCQSRSTPDIHVYKEAIASLADSCHCLLICHNGPLLAPTRQLPWRTEEVHGQRDYAYCIPPRVVRTDYRADQAGTYVLVGGHLFTTWCRVERCRVGESANRHAVLHVGHMRLRDDVEGTRGVLMLVFVGGPGRVVRGRGRNLGSSKRGLLEGSEGRVEGTAERLGECANVFGGGGESAECGHGGTVIGMTNSTGRWT